MIRLAYDLHVHIGPEIIPRKYTANSLGLDQGGKLTGCALKNHFYATSPMINSDCSNNLDMIGGIVLNNAVGGLNPEAVYAASLVTKNPLIVWLPTINAEHFLKNNKFEIAPEWVTDKSLKMKSAKETKPAIVTKNGKLLDKTKLVINMVKQINGILATGHISPLESSMIAKYARSLDIPVIITHPIYQHINMPISQQKKLAALGCYIEHTYSMYSLDGISIKKIVKQIKAVGVKSVIVTSDVGQIFSPSPSDALADFSMKLIENGLSISDLSTMLVTNPRLLIKKQLPS